MDLIVRDRHSHRDGAAIDCADSAILRRARTLGRMANCGPRTGIYRRGGIARLRHHCRSARVGGGCLHAGCVTWLRDRAAHHSAAPEWIGPVRTAGREFGRRERRAAHSRPAVVARPHAVDAGLELDADPRGGVHGAGHAADVLSRRPRRRVACSRDHLHQSGGRGPARRVAAARTPGTRRDSRFRHDSARLVAGDPRGCRAPRAAGGSGMTPDAISTVPLWVQSAAMPPPSTQALPARVDVLIIGAGYTGLAAARETAAAGRSTLVLDAGALGAGCSSRNGGQVAYSIKPSFAEL